MAGIAVEVSRFLRGLHRQDHRRSPFQRPHHRALFLLADDLHRSRTASGFGTIKAQDARRRGAEKPLDTFARIDVAAPGAGRQFSTSTTVNNLLRSEPSR
jgi:hypothetical protein